MAAGYPLTNLGTPHSGAAQFPLFPCHTTGLSRSVHFPGQQHAPSGNE